MATAPDLLRPLPEVSLRAMVEADVASVHANEVSAYEFPWSEGIFRDCLRVGYVCRVLELEHRIVAHGILSIGAGESHLLNVCVLDDYRGLGLGRMLLRHLLERARAGGAQYNYLEVRPSNVRAIRLYQTLGYEQVGVRHGYYQAAVGREDAVVLRLNLR
jgi:ribosomal-protein-alanine N-acetyltransferase